MPTYDYECQACGHAFERFQDISARKLRTCPECKQKRLRRLVGSGAGVIFRGSGFYETDYKRKQSPASASGSSPSSSPGSSPKTESSTASTSTSTSSPSTKSTSKVSKDK